MNSTEYIKKEARKSIAQALAFRRYLLDKGIDLRQDPIIGKLLAELAAPSPEQPDTAGAPTSGGMIKDPNRFEQLQMAIRDGTAREKFPVGTIFADTWTDTRNNKAYDMPIRLVHYGEINTRAGSPRFGATLQRIHATPLEVVFDGEDPDFPHGSNCLYLSEIVQWLNSDQPATSWWKALHPKDVPSEFTRTHDGYLRGCSAELMSCVAENVEVGQLTETGIHSMPCRFFLPSAEDLHISTGREDIENAVWEYYCDTPTDNQKPCLKRVFTNPSGIAQYCWLRSAYRGNAYRVWVAAADGSAFYNNALTAYACTPACVIV